MKTKYTKKQIQESIKHWQRVLESIDTATPGVWAEMHPNSIHECITILESVISDLVYELDERGGYSVLDDAKSAADNAFEALKKLIA